MVSPTRLELWRYLLGLRALRHYEIIYIRIIKSDSNLCANGPFFAACREDRTEVGDEALDDDNEICSVINALRLRPEA